MKNGILISIFTIYLYACYSNTGNKTTKIRSTESSTQINKYNLERIYPEIKTTEKFDTVISDRQLQIIIIKTDLDSYVINKYFEDDKLYIDKYRDVEIALTIKHKTRTVLDTIFRKTQFSNYADEDFMKIANFHNYWLENIRKDKIELFGIICQPETDYCLSFYHYFDLKNRKLKFEEYIDDDE